MPPLDQEKEQKEQKEPKQPVTFNDTDTDNLTDASNAEGDTNLGKVDTKKHKPFPIADTPL